MYQTKIWKGGFNFLRISIWSTKSISLFSIFPLCVLFSTSVGLNLPPPRGGGEVRHWYFAILWGNWRRIIYKVENRINSNYCQPKYYRNRKFQFFINNFFLQASKSYIYVGSLYDAESMDDRSKQEVKVIKLIDNVEGKNFLRKFKESLPKCWAKKWLKYENCFNVLVILVSIGVEHSLIQPCCLLQITYFMRRIENRNIWFSLCGLCKLDNACFVSVSGPQYNT